MTNQDEWVTQLAEALRTGTTLDLASRGDVDLLAEGPWPAERILPADAIRRVMLNPTPEADPRGLKIRGARIDGILDLRYSDILHRLTLQECFMPDGFQAEGSHLRWLDLMGSRLSMLNINTAIIDGELCMKKMIVEEDTQIIDTTITGEFSLAGAILSNPNGIALNLDRINVKGSLFADKGFSATGEVRALGATIAGQLVLNGATLSNPNGIALGLDGAKIGRGLFARGNFTATGEVRALGATIAGELRLTGATLSNTNGIALNLNRINIKGGIFANEGFIAAGEVHALGATITGQFDLDNATLYSPNGISLGLDDANVKGGIFAGRGFSAIGEFRAPGATITGQLDLGSAKLSNSDGPALNLIGANIDGNLYLPRYAFWKGGLHLEFCKITIISIINCIEDKKSASDSSLPGPLSANGWRVQDIHGDLAKDWKAIKSWLDTTCEFTSQPWEEIARIYDRNGDPISARHIRYNAARRITQNSPLTSKILGHVYRLTVGYGHYPLLAAAWIGLFIIIAAMLTNTFPSMFVPTSPNARQVFISDDEIRTPDSCPHLEKLVTAKNSKKCLTRDYPRLDPWSYAVATVTPAGALTTPTWEPQNKIIKWLLIILKLSGWLMTVFLLAGLTGILRKK